MYARFNMYSCAYTLASMVVCMCADVWIYVVCFLLTRSISGSGSSSASLCWSCRRTWFCISSKKQKLTDFNERGPTSLLSRNGHLLWLPLTLTFSVSISPVCCIRRVSCSCSCSRPPVSSSSCWQRFTWRKECKGQKRIAKESPSKESPSKENSKERNSRRAQLLVWTLTAFVTIFEILETAITSIV